MQKALLYASLMPHTELTALQDLANFSKLMYLHEELKTLPFGAVWDEYLAQQKVRGSDWFDVVRQYEKDVLSKRQ
jgi:L-rhamnose isomerase